MAEQRFQKVEELYEAHRNLALPLPLLKLEQHMHLKELLPRCPMEELGGYQPLSEDEINGNAPLANQPLCPGFNGIAQQFWNMLMRRDTVE